MECRECAVALTEENCAKRNLETNRRICRACATLRARRWRENNPEREIERQRRYHTENREKRQQQAREYYQQNKAAIAERERASRTEEKREQKRQYDRARYAANRDQLKAQRQVNRPKTASRSAARRARIAGAITPSADLAAIKAIYDRARRMTELLGVEYHVDHIKPLAMGGLHHQDNLVIMRGDWNMRKHTQHWPWLTWFNEP